MTAPPSSSPNNPTTSCVGISPKNSLPSMPHGSWMGRGAPWDPEERVFTRITISGAAGKQIWEMIGIGNVKRGPRDAAGHTERWWGHASGGRSPAALGVLPLPGYF